MSIIASPDCTNDKHRSCVGVGWDDELDNFTHCPCICHPKPPGATYREIEARTLSGLDIGKTITVPTENEPVVILEVDHSHHATFVLYRDKAGNRWTAHLEPTALVSVTGSPS